jgi:hypothetical protein
LSEARARTAARCRHDTTSCTSCDLLVGLDGLHVVAVASDEARGRLRIQVESPPALMGCPVCGVVAHSRGRREVRLVDAPWFGRPVEVVWRKLPDETTKPR